MDITGVTFDGGITVTAPSVAGTLYSWGYNRIYGQLGLGDLINRSNPTQIGGGSWRQVASGRNTQSLFAGAIAADGTLWTWGSNNSGSLGQGVSSGSYSKSSPVQVGTLNTWSKLNLGQDCGFAIKTDGTLWAWGLGATGQLGLNNQTDYNSPKQVGNLTNWKQVSAANGRSVWAVKTDGTLWAWGQNVDGRLGIGDTISRSSPTQIGTDTNWSQVAAGVANAFAIKTNGTLWGWGPNNIGQLGPGNTVGVTRSSPVQVGTDTDWASISVRTRQNPVIAAIKTNGTLWTWGTTGSGQAMQGRGAGIPNTSSPAQVGTNTNWAQVACGYQHTIATKTDGTLWAWGYNDQGQVGKGNTVAYFSPVQIGSATWWSTAAGYIAAGDLESFSATKITGAVNPPVQLTAVTGTPPTQYLIYTWGYNFYGQLGINNTVTQSSPVQVPNANPWGFEISKFGAGVNINHYIKNDGTLWGVGNNDLGQLGVNDKISRSTAVQVGTDTDWIEISDYYAAAGGIKSDGSLYTWGENALGSLGHNNTTNLSSPVQVGTDTNWSEVSLGFRSVTAVKSNGTLWAWGYNAQGQLGQSDTVNRSSPVQIGADTNWATSQSRDTFVVAVKTNGTLWSWGGNTLGRLGHNNTADLSSPVQIGTDTNWAIASPGGDFVIATKTNGTLWAWGNDSGGKLGINGDGLPVSSPVQIGTDTDWLLPGAGQNHGMAQKIDGTVWVWGRNTDGCLGLDLAPSASYSSPVQIGTGAWLSMFPTWQGAELIKRV